MFTGQADSLIIGSDIGHRARARNLNIHERGRCGPANPVEWLQPAGTTPIVIQPWDEKKLGADAPIETVRHAGYRLSAA